MYDHRKQYRCTIIRGKAKNEIDDLLPAYAKVIHEVCPCSYEDFEDKFNVAFARFLPPMLRSTLALSSTRKTLANHRTEISGKLFGMYYCSEDGIVYESERTAKFLEDDDQPAFFKEMCYKMQFPNGMQKSNTVQERLDDGINIRPNAFVLRVLQLAEANHVFMNLKRIGYYVLNSLDVLRGNAVPEEVIAAIQRDVSDGIERDIVVPGKKQSYSWQHIREQLNYLELANLIFMDNGEVRLNHKEDDTINIFAAEWHERPFFIINQGDLDTLDGRKSLQYRWDIYNGKLSDKADRFDTTANALVTIAPTPTQTYIRRVGTDQTAFGDEGELIILEYEKHRVESFDARLVSKVRHVGHLRGLGYDIQSVVAAPGEDSEFHKYIEVKSTRRVTSPDLDSSTWFDTLNLTRNEWIAALQYKKYYSIYRVYFTRDGIKVYVLDNIEAKYDQAKLQVIPTQYRVDLSADSIDSIIDLD